MASTQPKTKVVSATAVALRKPSACIHLLARDQEPVDSLACSQLDNDSNKALVFAGETCCTLLPAQAGNSSNSNEHHRPAASGTQVAVEPAVASTRPIRKVAARKRIKLSASAEKVLQAAPAAEEAQAAASPATAVDPPSASATDASQQRAFAKAPQLEGPGGRQIATVAAPVTLPEVLQSSVADALQQAPPVTAEAALPMRRRKGEPFAPVAPAEVRKVAAAYESQQAKSATVPVPKQAANKRRKVTPDVSAAPLELPEIQAAPAAEAHPKQALRRPRKHSTAAVAPAKVPQAGLEGQQAVAIAGAAPKQAGKKRQKASTTARAAKVEVPEVDIDTEYTYSPGK